MTGMELLAEAARRELDSATCVCCADLPAVALGYCPTCYVAQHGGWRCKHQLDDVNVERLIAGQPVRSTITERLAAAEYGTRHGWSIAIIAEHLHCSPRTVCRYRGRLKAAIP